MLTKWLDFFSSASILFPLIIAIINFKYLNRELKYFSIFLLYAASIEIITYVMSLLRLNNLWLMNIYALIEGIFLIWLLGKWNESKKMYFIAIALIIFYFAYWCYTTLLLEGIMVFNTRELSVKAIILIVLSGHLLIHLGLKDEVKLATDSTFWISSGILFYFLVSLVVFSTANIILEDKNPAMNYTWTIHSVINIIANLLYFYAFICYRKTNSYSSL